MIELDYGIIARAVSNVYYGKPMGLVIDGSILGVNSQLVTAALLKVFQGHDTAIYGLHSDTTVVQTGIRVGGMYIDGTGVYFSLDSWINYYQHVKLVENVWGACITSIPFAESVSNSEKSDAIIDTLEALYLAEIYKLQMAAGGVPHAF